MPAVFVPLYDLVPAVVAVPPTNGTVKTLTDILRSTFSYTPERYAVFEKLMLIISQPLTSFMSRLSWNSH